MEFVLFFMILIKYISSSDIINVNPYERLNITISPNESAYFKFSTKSIAKTNESLINFDFYSKNFEYSYLYVYFNYSSFLEDKSNKNFSHSDESFKIDYLSDFKNYQVSGKNITDVFFVIHNQHQFTSNNYSFQVYDFFNMIYIENSFFSSIYIKVSFDISQFLFIKLKKFSEPIYCHILLSQFLYNTYSDKRNYNISIYNNSITKENMMGVYIVSYNFHGSIYLESNIDYYITINQSKPRSRYYINDEKLTIYIIYSIFPNLTFSLDNGENRLPLFIPTYFYFYKNISHLQIGDSVNFMISFTNFYNQSTTNSLDVYYSKFKTLYLSNATLINSTLSKLSSFSLEKKRFEENYIIFKLNIDKSYNDFFISIKVGESNPKTFLIIFIIIFVVVGLLSGIFYCSLYNDNDFKGFLEDQFNMEF